jgi:hypothetical protein
MEKPARGLGLRDHHFFQHKYEQNNRWKSLLVGSVRETSIAFFLSYRRIRDGKACSWARFARPLVILRESQRTPYGKACSWARFARPEDSLQMTDNDSNGKACSWARFTRPDVPSVGAHVERPARGLDSRDNRK